MKAPRSNIKLIPSFASERIIIIIGIDANKIANEQLSARVFNIIILGVLLEATHVLELSDIKNAMEDQLNSNPKINVETADFIAINDDIYYMVISSIASEKSEIKRNEFMFVKDNNLYSFEFVYPYADAELDDFYLNIIRSMEIKKPKYLVSGEGYKINDE